MIRFNKLILGLTVVLLGVVGINEAAAQETSAEEVKIGYVNPQAILASMPEMRAVQQRLQNFTVRKQQELSEKEQAFQAEVATYQQKIGVISAEAQAQEEERLGVLQNELLQAQQAAETELQEKQNELLGPLYEQIGNAINTVAERMELTYVLNTTTSTGDLVILYASEDYREKYDITEAVMEELGMF
ncbi:MAG: OmpH family outer membrane protein [Balneolales bacterium]|nr:OmpH family outer membrane protein [Balneolales bacterium]